MLRRLGSIVAFFTLVGPVFAAEPLSRSQREEDLRQLLGVIRRVYAYVEEKKSLHGLDLDAVEASLLARLDGIAFDADFHGLLAEVVAELRDGHCDLSLGRVGPHLPRVWPVTLRSVKEGIVVSVARAELGPGAGVAAGDLVTGIDGRPVEACLAEAARRAPASTDGARRRTSLVRTARTAADSVEFSIVRPDGTAATVTLPTLPPAAAGAPGAFAEARVLRAGVGYIRVPAFHCTDPAFQKAATDADRDAAFGAVRREIDAAFEMIAGTRALVLDLRGNVGGSDLIGQYLVSHLVPGDFVNYRTRTRVSPDLMLRPGFNYLRGQKDWGPEFVWKLRDLVFTSYRGEPHRGERFSMTDCVSACLKDLRPGVRFLGRPTHCGAGGPAPVARLTHSEVDVWLCIMRVLSPNGRPIEGHGTTPDVPVEWTRDDVLLCRDPDLEAALEEVR